MARVDASPAPAQSAREFVWAFGVSFVAVLLAVLVFNISRPNFALDWIAALFLGALALVALLVATWFFLKKELQTAWGIVFGFSGGIVFGILSLIFIALSLVDFVK